MVEQTIDALARPISALLEEARRVPATRAEHDRFVAALPCLHAIECVAPPKPVQLGNRIRIAAWNAERCKYLPESAALLAGIGADVVLLSELDVGMARSGNRHTARELARSLGSGYLFGVEYVELGLGDNREKAWHAGQSNEIGLHGNGILSKAALERPVVIHLDEGARWFAGAQATAERRIGWRMAIGAEVMRGGAPLFVCSVHLESSTDPADRAAQCAVLLRAVEERVGGMPVVIAGDFNTAALPPADADDASWFRDPARFEPLFQLFADAGYDWRVSNRPAATERTRPDGTPEPPFRKIDWVFSRGVKVERAFTLAATDLQGSAISDHDAIVIDINGPAQTV